MSNRAYPGAGKHFPVAASKKNVEDAEADEKESVLERELANPGDPLYEDDVGGLKEL